jgi:hypothetical protein
MHAYAFANARAHTQVYKETQQYAPSDTEPYTMLHLYMLGEGRGCEPLFGVLCLQSVLQKLRDCFLLSILTYLLHGQEYYLKS